MDCICPKCQKTLVPMHDKHYAYCPKKESIFKFGDPWNRKYKIQVDPTSGCGTVFEVPLSEFDELAELEKIYRPKNKVEHGGFKKSHTLSNSNGKSIPQGNRR